MIVDQIGNIDRYKTIHKNITLALDFISNHIHDEMNDGKYEISGEDVVAYVVTKDTISPENAKMEIHKKYMDIHCMLSGSETCGITELPEEYDKLIPYDDQTDNGFFDKENTFTVKINKGEFYAVWPLEPHRPLCYAEKNSERIKKIICKVKVD